MLDQPRYRDLRRYFRPTTRGVAVEFFEMRLTREQWLTRKWQASQRTAGS